MQGLALAAVVGLVGGVAIGMQSPLASMASQRIGALESAAVVHVVGLLLAIVLLAFAGGTGFGQWRAVPSYAWAAGLFGVVLIVSISYTIPRIGMAPTLALVITGQLVLAVLIDHFGILEVAVHPIDPTRLAGLAALALGTFLIMRG